ncbi:MAG: ISL3 family transposase [Myxococcales bacterium]|nr:ISL3 family transposase [Myxococcales bacterium]
MLGIDEHFFSRKHGFATTLVDLQTHRVFDVVQGRSEAALRPYLTRLAGKERTAVVLMDLAESYRSLVRQHFPRALIVADRFHVIRLVNHAMLDSWRQLDPVGRRHRGLVSLLRRHPENLRDDAQRQRLADYLAAHPLLEALYHKKQALMTLLRYKHQSARQCRQLAPRFLGIVQELRAAPMAPLRTLGDTLWSWRAEIARMWRFTKTNSITEGLHNKMELISRRAYGFRNFQNYRLRVRALCG